MKVILSDLSSKALAIAKENAKKNEVDVEFRQGDLLAPFLAEKADYITCNPPYIPQKEFNELDKEVKNFEPQLALLGGEKGGEFYERLAEELSNFLHSGSKFYAEIGYNQKEELINLFNKSPWKNQRVESDWAGHDRFFFLEKE